ncbi:MAG: SIMPL domain-containing protein [Sphingomonadales bacterium]|jgi:uncharacterized protein YggE
MKNIILSAALLFAAALTAQNPATGEEKPYIEVNGNGEMEVTPDEIFVAITILERSTNKKTISVEEQEQNLKNALKNLKVDLKNLSLAGADADLVRIEWRKKGVITQKQYSLKLGNATILGQVFTELDKLEITDAYVSHVQHSKIDSLRKVVKIMAIKSAKNKADYLLAAIGEKTGKALIVRENDPYYPQPVWTMANARMDKMESTSSNETYTDPIDFKKIKVTSSIYVKFGIQ